ncbi:MAG: hypothetical protein LC637_11130, partial [Xanthomonadaceae bacterium]|nr:hypothetical protein [Xanthomonadaceae bacterium]
ELTEPSPIEPASLFALDVMFMPLPDGRTGCPLSTSLESLRYGTMFVDNARSSSGPVDEHRKTGRIARDC